MKRAALIAIPILVGLVVGGTSAAMLYVRQVIQPPTWYRQPASNATADLDPEAVRRRVMRRITVTDNNQVEATIEGEELGILVEEAIASNPDYGKVLEKTRNFSARIEDGQIKTGVTVNLNDVMDYLGETEQQWVEQAVTLFPGIADRPLYIGVEGRPRMEDGQLWLDQDTVILVGNMRLSPELIARQLGIDPAVLDQGIQLNLNVEGIDIHAIDLEGDRAIVRGILQQS